LPRKSPKAKKLIIAIDGPAGSGKSTTARALAARLGLPYIDTGAMYRAVTLKAMRKGVSLTDVPALARIARTIRIRFAGRDRVFMDGHDVTRAIRTPELTQNVVFIAREPLIRRQMVKKQRAMGRTHGAVMEGRDIGSVVFPKARYKFYFDATPRLRALRRYRELVASGKRVRLEQIYREIEQRDVSDRRRKAGALKVARGARVIDTTGLTIPATVDRILGILGDAAGS
jgi:cytidylate kinase